MSGITPPSRPNNARSPRSSFSGERRSNPKNLSSAEPESKLLSTYPENIASKFIHDLVHSENTIADPEVQQELARTLNNPDIMNVPFHDIFHLAPISDKTFEKYPFVLSKLKTAPLKEIDDFVGGFFLSDREFGQIIGHRHQILTAKEGYKTRQKVASLSNKSFNNFSKTMKNTIDSFNTGRQNFRLRKSLKDKVEGDVNNVEYYSGIHLEDMLKELGYNIFSDIPSEHTSTEKMDCGIDQITALQTKEKAFIETKYQGIFFLPKEMKEKIDRGEAQEDEGFQFYSLESFLTWLKHSGHSPIGKENLFENSDSGGNSDGTTSPDDDSLKRLMQEEGSLDPDHGKENWFTLSQLKNMLTKLIDTGRIKKGYLTEDIPTHPLPDTTSSIGLEASSSPKRQPSE